MKGKMGTCPEWYRDAQAAKYLGIPVPDIVNVPLWWIDKATIAMNAEAEGRRIQEQHK